MNIERLYDCERPRHRVWCMSSELTAGAADGTYTVNNSRIAAELGEGSEIIVIDQPGKILFWDAENGIAYDWTTAASAEEGE